MTHTPPPDDRRAERIRVRSAATHRNSPAAGNKKKKRDTIRSFPRRIGSVFDQSLSDRIGADLHHHALNISWTKFFALAGVIFILFNLLFAGLLDLGAEPIANLQPDGFTGLFYFSIETLSTVGYGDMHPRTQYAHLITTIEIFTGMSFIAVMTGLVFTRFSRPRARIVFAKQAVVSTHEGLPTLMIRMANARNNTLITANAKLWLARNEISSEGLTLRSYYELELAHGEHPAFSTNWLVFHEINATSPLKALTSDDLVKSAAILLMTVTGIDETTSQQVHARRVYPATAIRWQHHYADVVATGPEGTLGIDARRFHDVQADP